MTINVVCKGGAFDGVLVDGLYEDANLRFSNLRSSGPVRYEMTEETVDVDGEQRRVMVERPI